MRVPPVVAVVLGVGLAACGGDDGGGDGHGDRHDAALADGGDGDASALDAALDGPPIDARPIDARVDAAVDAAIDARPPIISGGPCISGAPGATAYRIRWTGPINGTASVVYEVNGLPDQSRDRAGAYGYQIGFTPRFVDPFLGEGGLQLDGSDFVDIELSTVGLSQITRATLSIYGRSYNTTASGSFHWQTFDGVGSTPTNLVSNVAPYRWYGGDMTGEISPGDDGVLLRIKAGPSSGSLVVNRIELCLVAS